MARRKQSLKKSNISRSKQQENQEQSQSENSAMNILSPDDQNFVNLPSPLTTRIEEIEAGESPSAANDNTPIENVVSANEDAVTIPSSTLLPKYLRKDRISSKFAFYPNKFDYSSEISKFKLDNKEYVKSLKWHELNSKLSKLMNSYYASLSIFYKYGLSAKFKRDFCVAVAMNLPLCEKQYRKVRKQSAKGLLKPDLTKTVKKQILLSDLLFIRLDQNSRVQVKKVAKENGQQLTVKKRVGEAVAENNRKRKTLRLEQSS